MSNPIIRKVAVLGAGVMGAQIAAHLVNADVDTVLFDLPAKEGAPNGIVDKAIATCVPGLSKEELYWRLDFLAGALTYAMADFGLIKRPADVTEAAHRERAARELIRFAEAGIRAGH